MINVVVEGDSDQGVARAIVQAAGQDVGRLLVAGGKTRLDPKIGNYVRASVQTPWVVFRDSDGECPVALHERLLMRAPSAQDRFALRIAHTMSEAWLLADREAVSKYFSVPVNRIPLDPESVPHAKRALLQLCSKSRSSRIRDEMTVANGKTGPLYVLHLNEFASRSWRVEEAATASDSLRRAVVRISNIAQIQ